MDSTTTNLSALMMRMQSVKVRAERGGVDFPPLPPPPTEIHQTPMRAGRIEATSAANKEQLSTRKQSRATVSEADRRMRELIANGNSVADWAEFLQSQWAHSAKPTQDLEKLYCRATQEIEVDKNKKNELLLLIYLEHARIISFVTPKKTEDVRQIFEYLLSERICQDYSLLLSTMADFEVNSKKKEDLLRRAESGRRLSEPATRREELFQQFLGRVPASKDLQQDLTQPIPMAVPSSVQRAPMGSVSKVASLVTKGSGALKAKSLFGGTSAFGRATRVTNAQLVESDSDDDSPLTIQSKPQTWELEPNVSSEPKPSRLESGIFRSSDDTKGAKSVSFNQEPQVSTYDRPSSTSTVPSTSGDDSRLSSGSSEHDSPHALGMTDPFSQSFSTLSSLSSSSSQSQVRRTQSQPAVFEAMIHPQAPATSSVPTLHARPAAHHVSSLHQITAPSIKPSSALYSAVVPHQANVVSAPSVLQPLSAVYVAPGPQSFAPSGFGAPFPGTKYSSGIPSTPVASAPVSHADDEIIIAGARYKKLDQIGKGGSSLVFRLLGPDRKVYALKEVDLSSADDATIESYVNEIQLLMRLQGRSSIIQLVTYDQDQAKKVLYLVMECGDVDLATMLKNRRLEKKVIDENHLRLYWQQMLEAVQTIHSEKIVHSDLKPANFLFVSGILKLIDFGIAKGIQDDHTSIERDNQIGTLNYMSPEALQTRSSSQHTFKVGEPSDVWSLGCILYAMVYGQTPFQTLNPLQKIQAIVDPTYTINYPLVKNSTVVDVMRLCLQRNPRERPSISQLLEHPFLHPEHSPPQPPSIPVPPPLPVGGVPTAVAPGLISVTPEQLMELMARSQGGDLTPRRLLQSVLGPRPRDPQEAKRKAGTPLKHERKSRPQPLQEIDVNAIQNAHRALKPVSTQVEPAKIVHDEKRPADLQSLMKSAIQHKFASARGDDTLETEAWA